MRRVRVLFLGGTIAMTSATTTAAARPEGLEPELAGADLLSSVSLPDDVSVDPVDVAQVDSSALTMAVCLEAFAAAEAVVLNGEADGVVVVQGTDTLEETAYLWDLLWRHPHPFVVTGAMRSADMPGTDGPANLVAAIAVAASDAFRGTGVVVVVGDEIHAARHVAKRHTTSLSALASPEAGPLGRVEESGPVVLAQVPRRDAVPAPREVVPVGLVRATLDDDPALYRAAADLSAGLVVEGFGGGQVRPEVAEVLTAVAGELPVVLASRTGAGAVATRTYAGPGSASHLVASGVIPCGRLSGPKARVLLRLLLGGDPAPTIAEVAAAFEHHGA